MTETIRCTECGVALEPGDRFCHACGAGAPAPGAAALADAPGAAGLSAVSTRSAVTWPGAAASPPPPAAATMAGPAAPEKPAAKERGWFMATRPSSMLGSALMLLIGALLLMGIGQIDQTGTIVIISLLVLEGAAAMLLLGLARGVVGLFAKA